MTGDRFARRFSEEFGFDYLWLLGEQDDPKPPSSRIAKNSPVPILWLPVFLHPIECPPIPREAVSGTYFPLCGLAAERAKSLARPYVLQFQGRGLSPAFPQIRSVVDWSGSGIFCGIRSSSAASCCWPD